jgi:hypothetical protein
MAEEREKHEVREEIRIALFWRQLIGDAEYNRYQPDDYDRWYRALEMRGPEEIRELVDTRFMTQHKGVLTGLVTERPFPPLWVVREWLSTHENRVHTGGYWLGFIGFLTLVFMLGPFVYGCQQLTSLNPLDQKPPSSEASVLPLSPVLKFTQPLPPSAPPLVSPIGPATSAGMGPAPASTPTTPASGAAPASGVASTGVTGPTSSGIAGSAGTSVGGSVSTGAPTGTSTGQSSSAGGTGQQQ